MRGLVVAAALALAASCRPAAPTLDTQVVQREVRTCCCAVVEPAPVFEVLDDSVCASVGGTCTEDAPCEAFATEPCCCITFREDGERRVEPSTWAECVEPGTCHLGDCGPHR